MYAFLSFIHIVDCALLIVSVLLQSSKGSGLAGAFGGQGTQAVFGGRGAGTFLSRATSVLAIVFMLTSLTMTMIGSGGSGGRKSALAEAAKKEGVAAPFQQPGTELPPGSAAQPPLGAPGTATDGSAMPTPTDGSAPATNGSVPPATDGTAPTTGGSTTEPPSGGN